LNHCLLFLAWSFSKIHLRREGSELLPTGLLARRVLILLSLCVMNE
jgi:hypothetical protein